MTEKDQKRFWSMVQKTDSCWFWTGGLDHRKKYGAFWRKVSWAKKYKATPAHRASWEFAHGPIPEGACVLHSCDVMVCVRPDHLFLGTRKENNEDRDSKGRQVPSFGMRNGAHTHPECRPRGERHGRARLTAAQVVRIVERCGAGELQVTLAREFDVSQMTISNIMLRKTWRH